NRLKNETEYAARDRGGSERPDLMRRTSSCGSRHNCERLWLDRTGRDVRREILRSNVCVMWRFNKVSEHEACHQLAADLLRQRVAVLDRPVSVGAHSADLREVERAKRQPMAHDKRLLIERFLIEEVDVGVHEPGQEQTTGPQDAERLRPEGREVGAEHRRHGVNNEVKGVVFKRTEVAHIAQDGAKLQNLARGDLVISGELLG